MHHQAALDSQGIVKTQALLERRIGTRFLYAAVFDRVEHGTYTLWHRGAAVRRGVFVAGGRVAECALAEEASSRV